MYIQIIYTVCLLNSLIYRYVSKTKSLLGNSERTESSAERAGVTQTGIATTYYF